MIETLADLKQDLQNTRKHNPRNVGMITRALHEVGAARSGVIDEAGRILAGNATYEALAEAGIEKVRVVEADGNEWVVVQRKGLSEEQKKKLALYDNRTAELAEWDVERLVEEVNEGLDLKGLWNEKELDELLAELDTQERGTGDAEPQTDKAEELREKWGVELGQVWKLGDHRLACGDCTDRAVVEAVMRGERAAIGLHDPPYGINVDTSWLSALHIQRGKPPNVSDDKLQGDDGLLDVSVAFGFDRWFVWGFPYIHHAEMTGWLVWDKWPGIEEGGLGNPVEMACTNLWKGFRIKRIMWGGYYKEKGEKRFPHPTQKPLGVIEPWIAEFTGLHDVVADYFVGSGTTLIVCERLGRKCRAIEISPGYCAVAIQRMADAFPGIEIKRLAVF